MGKKAIEKHCKYEPCSAIFITWPSVLKKYPKDFCSPKCRHDFNIAKRKEVVTQEYLKSLLIYNPETGHFHWIKPRNSTLQRAEFAGSLDKKVISITINKKHYKAHRLAWLYTYGHFPEGEVQHINKIRTDNRISNLRLKTK